MSLSQDLATIRVDQQLSLDDLYSLSKLPLGILESIEDGSIFTDESKNITYKRSFIRSYAKALRIDDADITKALDTEFEGTYKNELLAKYTGRGTATELKNVVNPRHIIAETPNTSPAVPVHKTEEQIKRSKPAPSELETPQASTKPATPVSATPVKKVSSDLSLPPQPDQTSYNKTQKPPTISTVDWATVGSSPISLNSIPKIVFGVLSLLIVIAAIYWLFMQDFEFTKSDSSETSVAVIESPKEESIPTIVDSLSQISGTAEVVQSGNPAEVVAPTLPDTLFIMIVAANDKLEPVRVKTDLSGSYFPYWLEQGNAMKFNFLDQIEIKGQYNRMAFIFNDRVVEEFKNNRGTNREVLISRSYLMSNLAWLQPATDEEKASLPQNLKILDRPVFN